MTKQHTPTPWRGKIDGKWGDSGEWIVEHPDCGSAAIAITAHNNRKVVAIVVQAEDEYESLELLEANAAFIVRACNAHDELVAALEETRVFLQIFLDAETSVVGIEQIKGRISRNDAALRKARGEV